jgi:putative ABC transport system substrate-binding protein
VKRREFIALLGGAAAWPLTGQAQQTGKIYRIGILDLASRELNGANLNAFQQGLHEFGYNEGQNLIIEYRSGDGRPERFPNLANDLVRLNVDLILTRGTPAALAVKNATTTIPIVLSGLGDPVANGIVASLARPGANITGLSGVTTELQAKRVEVLTELVPRIARFGCVTNMGNPNEQLNWEQTETAARVLGIHSQLIDVRKSEDIRPAFDDASKQHVEAVVVMPDGLLLSNRKLVVELAATHRLPAIYSTREFVDSGGLASYGPNFPDLYHRAATFVDKIFKGTKPADLPVEQPTKFELVINLKTAKALDLTVPPSLLARADEVIE